MPSKNANGPKYNSQKIGMYISDATVGLSSLAAIIMPINPTTILEGTDNGHFICVYKHNDTIVYFDSYGRTDKQIINSIDDDVKLLNDETYPHLTKLLKQANDKITINKRVLQDEKSAVCGRWCCFVIMNAYKHKNLNDLLNYYKFDDDTEANDKKILYLTHRYL